MPFYIKDILQALQLKIRKHLHKVIDIFFVCPTILIDFHCEFMHFTELLVVD